ncbi:MAG: isoleucine--tRNA ligase [Eggerthellaceae bacterium]|nr:isoleucine--tRNA ligase [Eggerthellaceae bacterium]
MGNSYKASMNLPKTDFPMRARLPENEPKRLKFWDDIDIYHKVLEKNKDNKPFVLHDGPPYANGPIHIGHAFNKILKDFVLKSHAQQGYYTPYIPGWDCHGQPIEHMVEKTLGPKKMAAIDQPTLRRLCHDWAVKYVNIQRDGFKRLGVNADWEHPYLTFQHSYEAGDVEIFKKMYLDGSIYRGRKPIHWCKHCHTALAEAEIEYGDETSPSIFVKFALDKVPPLFQEAGIDQASILIWTTTPWTLPANSGVCLAPNADYCMVHVDNDYMILAYEMVESVAKTAEWTSYDIVSSDAGDPILYSGKDLCGYTYTCPIRQDLKGTVIYGDHVTLDSGTGAVHTAPGHGQDDYEVGLKFGLPILMPVDDDGVLTDDAGPFAGLDTDDANPVIINWLKEHNMLVAEVEITHSYPHCWRCKQPVIFRATDQWFVSMDKNDLRSRAMDQINNHVNWVPAWAKNRIGSMVSERPDWCISRQRSWGIPIPVFRCAKCGEVVATPETFDAVIDLFNKEGSDAWFIHDPSDYLPKGTHCEKCGCTDLVPEKDILDVWWESGVSHTSVCKKREGLHFPADLYLEGSDQHRGWFQSSLLTSVGAYGTAPYKTVMHCGFTVDGQGRKMSKSLGNGIAPSEVTDKYGADVLRLWVASVDYSQDVSISEEILTRTSEAYRHLRNTFRFLLGNLSDFDDENDAITSWDDLEPIDQWAMVRLSHLLDEVNEGYQSYNFHQVYQAIYRYIIGDLSSVYMDALKDRLYSEAADSPRRRAAQTVLMNILEMLVRVLTPIISFTTEEVWQHYPETMRNRDGRAESVQLAGWPEAHDFVPSIPTDATSSISNDFETILSIRDQVTKAIEQARTDGTIHKSQEAELTVTLPQAMFDVVSSYDEAVFIEMFIVATVSFKADEVDEPVVTVAATDLPRCPRCWNHRALDGNKEHSEVCARCSDVLSSIDNEMKEV